jgi:hypothetical protein
MESTLIKTTMQAGRGSRKNLKCLTPITRRDQWKAMAPNQRRVLVLKRSLWGASSSIFSFFNRERKRRISRANRFTTPPVVKGLLMLSGFIQERNRGACPFQNSVEKAGDEEKNGRIGNEDGEQNVEAHPACSNDNEKEKHKNP